MTIDAGNRQAGGDHIDVNPEANKNYNDKETNSNSSRPGGTTLKLYFLIMGKMTSPTKNYRLAITLTFETCGLLSISLRFVRATWALVFRPTRCLTIHL